MFRKSATYQFAATVCVNLISISYGTSAGWPSSSSIVLQSDKDTPLGTGALSTEQMSWIGSLLGIGGLCGSILFGWLSDRVGRKKTLCMLAAPAIISWLLIIIARNAGHLYAARFLCGLSSGGSFVLVPLFVAEIAEDRIRGSLGSLMMLSVNLGVLLMFIAGYCLPYSAVAPVFIVIPIVFLVSIVFFPDTPFYFMRTNRELKAIQSLEFYRNVKTGEQRGLISFDGEITKLLTNDCSGDPECLTPLCLEDFTNRGARKAFAIGLFLMFLHEFCGCFTMINYTASIFADSGSKIPPKLSAIIVGVVQLIGTMVSTKLVDRAGRKFLLIFSAVGSGLSLVTLGTYSYLNVLGYAVQPYSWVAVTSFSSMLFLASCGIISLPFVVLAEVMPERIRSIGATVCLCFSWTMVFGMVKVFPGVEAAIGLHGCMFLFAGCCFVGAVFIAIVLPETKGKSYDEILIELNQ